MSNLMLITTIKPTMGAFVSFQPRTKEGEAKRPEVFASYNMPQVISSINDSDLNRFVRMAYESELILALRAALTAGKPEFNQLNINECFVTNGKREFTVTKEKVIEWLNTYAQKILESAICAKSGLNSDHAKVVKKVIEYRELMSLASARSIISQNDIDSMLRVLELINNQSVQNAYTDNVLQGVARQQEKLDEFLANGSKESEGSDVDF